ncbi:hypothetical protein BBJ28_00020423 [Nothophytophthora sp. Chile5]|nr:hypothetical protein BBJ28_00020423 [Nothophytophthora sp. Chile5]
MASLQLTRVALVLRAHPAVRLLPSVTGRISSFLGPSRNLSLSRACSFGSLALLDHLWESSCASSADRTSGWSLCNFLRSDLIYFRRQFSKALLQAVRHGHLHVAEWLFTRFIGCEARVEVVEKAAATGDLEMLQFLHAQGIAAKYRERQRGEQHVGLAIAEGQETGIVVRWGRNDMQNAAKNGHPEIVRWLFENTAIANSTRHLRDVVKSVLELGDLALAEWLIARGSPDVPLDGARTGRPDVIKWLLARGQLKNERLAAEAIKRLASGGHLTTMQRLVRLHHPSSSPSWEWQNAWVIAFREAHHHSHLHVVQWLLENPLNPQLRSLFSLGVHQAAVKGHLQLAQYLYDEGFPGCSTEAMLVAARNGDLKMVEWIYNHFGNTSGSGLFAQASGRPNVMGDPNCLEVEAGPVASAMDAAAVNGHLEVLQFLHGLNVSTEHRGRKRHRDEAGDSERDGRKPWATHIAMDGAAERGHLEVVKWLHANRTESCTTAAMNAAAANDHLPVVQWLHANTSEGCTTAAMDSAAANGHLKMVQWLHSNRPEGCTTEAMDNAALNDQLEMLQWLHKNRSEGCTGKALDSAVASGHLRVVEWLLDHHVSSHVPSAKAMQKAGSSSFEMLLLLHTQCPQAFNQSVLGGMFNSVPDHIRAWLVAQYSSHYM